MAPPLGNIPWNKGKKNPRIKGNKFAFLGEKAGKNAGNHRAQILFKEIKPCEKCGLKKESFQMVRHHKNDNTLDNRVRNIQWLCRSCHAKHHRKTVWKNYYEQTITR